MLPPLGATKNFSSHHGRPIVFARINALLPRELSPLDREELEEIFF
jgi:hypothetical protein